MLVSQKLSSNFLLKNVKREIYIFIGLVTVAN